jgi:hypothetical protein
MELFRRVFDNSDPLEVSVNVEQSILRLYR